MSLRELFNMARWHDRDLAQLRVVIVHRGAPGDVRAIDGAEICDILAGGMTVRAKDADIEPTFVPWHRVVEVRGAGGVRWPRGSMGGDP